MIFRMVRWYGTYFDLFLDFGLVEWVFYAFSAKYLFKPLFFERPKRTFERQPGCRTTVFNTKIELLVGVLTFEGYIHIYIILS
jgi:hypothetical protein